MLLKILKKVCADRHNSLLYPGYHFVYCREFKSDFDEMLRRKKEEMGKKHRKRKDVDIINDSDDLIAALMQNMKTAAEVRLQIITVIHGINAPSL